MEEEQQLGHPLSEGLALTVPPAGLLRVATSSWQLLLIRKLQQLGRRQHNRQHLISIRQAAIHQYKSSRACAARTNGTPHAAGVEIDKQHSMAAVGADGPKARPRLSGAASRGYNVVRQQLEHISRSYGPAFNCRDTLKKPISPLCLCPPVGQRV